MNSVPDDGAEKPEDLEQGWRKIRYRHTPQLADLLRQAGCSLLISTYQAGELVAVGEHDGELSCSFHSVERAMGVAVGSDTIAVGGRNQIWFLRENREVAPSIEPQGQHDSAFLARTGFTTGEIRCHELAWGEDDRGAAELWVVNTLFSCLATASPSFNFVPRWRPPFISALAPEDRCHLNGLAMHRGRPAMVTVMAESDTAGGWRENKNETGRIINVDSGEVVSEGLAMPHSPRLYRGRLMVLNSGHGTLEQVDEKTGGREVIASVPGYTRGLAFRGNLAFVGLSRIRETAVFGGVPIAEHHEDLLCGVGVIDITTGRTVATLVFESGVEEIFDVQVVPGVRCPAISGPSPDRDQSGEVWVVPPESSPAATDA
jgi:uncharacterized protein (TIGR03032 family)